MTSDLWQRGCERLAAELPEQQYNTWIRPLPPADLSEAEGAAVVQVRVPNRFKLDWIRSQYATRIEAILSELAGAPVRLALTLAQRELPPPTRPLPSAGPVRAAALLNGQAVPSSTRVAVTTAGAGSPEGLGATADWTRGLCPVARPPRR